MDFIHPAINTDVLLMPKEKRQSRPLYIYGGHYLGEGICALFEISGKTEFLNNLKGKMNSDMIHYFEQYNDPWYKVMAYYLGFVLVNFLILLGAAYFMTEIVFMMNILPVIGLLIFPIFLVNVVTKSFVWTVHQQMFTIFTPIFLIWVVFKYGLKTTKFYNLLTITSICSVLFLFYGNFILSLPVLLICFIYQNWDNRFNFKFYMKTGLVFILFALPTILWMIIVTHYAGFYYNYEIEEFRQLVWVFDYLKNLGVLKTGYLILVYTLNFLKTFLFQDILPFIIISLVLVLIYAKEIKNRSISFNKMELGIFAIFLLSFLFFWALGYYRPRITFFLVIPIIIWLGYKISNHWSNYYIRFSTIIFVLFWCAKQYLTSGPFV